MEKESMTVGEFVEEQLLDVYRGDIHKILSNVHRDLESLGCKDLPKVEEHFQLIESNFYTYWTYFEHIDRILQESGRIVEGVWL